ncbi:hypothetical protein OERS_33510 [Oerskovia enterophila]|uniref:Uncharacterized protein n=1 Tax=Oerskovia enterophila TaxID=43678 RepID=A0ABX2Y097_9CELL|nr:hypothetical protein OERS_33510 [Oerskovia enterophila]
MVPRRGSSARRFDDARRPPGSDAGRAARPVLPNPGTTYEVATDVTMFSIPSTWTPVVASAGGMYIATMVV